MVDTCATSASAFRDTDFSAIALGALDVRSKDGSLRATAVTTLIVRLPSGRPKELDASELQELVASEKLFVSAARDCIFTLCLVTWEAAGRPRDAQDGSFEFTQTVFHIVENLGVRSTLTLASAEVGFVRKELT